MVCSFVSLIEHFCLFTVLYTGAYNKYNGTLTPVKPYFGLAVYNSIRRLANNVQPFHLLRSLNVEPG